MSRVIEGKEIQVVLAQPSKGSQLLGRPPTDQRRDEHQPPWVGYPGLNPLKHLATA